MKTIVASLLVAIATTAFGAELSQKITTPSGIIVHLPSQWQEIPTQVITAQFEEVAKQNPKPSKNRSMNADFRHNPSSGFHILMFWFKFTAQGAFLRSHSRKCRTLVKCLMRKCRRQPTLHLLSQM